MEEKGEGTRAHFNQAFIELKTGNIIAGGPSFAVPFTRGIWKRWGEGLWAPITWNIDIFIEEKRLVVKGSADPFTLSARIIVLLIISTSRTSFIRGRC